MCKESFVIFKTRYVATSCDLFIICLYLSAVHVHHLQLPDESMAASLVAKQPIIMQLCIVGMEVCDTTCLCVVISNGLRNIVTIALKNETELL